METILVTGGAGFIGSNLIKQLLQDYPLAEIISLDNYSLGEESNQLPGAIYVNGNTWDIETLFEGIKFDAIYHFGEYSRVTQSFEDYKVAAQSILYGTSQVLDFAAKTGAKLIYSASSSALGNDGKDQALSPYAWMKAKQVEQIKLYGEWFDLDWTICYFYNVWGQNQISTGRHATVIGIWEEAVKANQPIYVFSTGEQKRRFTHIDAIVNGVLLATDYSQEEFHLANPEIWTILEAAKLFGEPHFLPKRKGDRETTAPNIEGLQPEGWLPGKSLIDNLYANPLDLHMLDDNVTISTKPQKPGFFKSLFGNT